MKKKIGIFVGSHLSIHFKRKKSINVITVLDNWGKMLSDYYDLDIVSLYPPPSSLCRYFSFWGGAQRLAYLPNILADFILCLGYAKQNNPDVLLHISNPHRDGLIICIVGYLLDIRVIVRYTGDTYNRYQSARSFFQKIKTLISLVTSHFAYKYATRVLSLGPLMKTDLEARTGRSVDVLPMPLDQNIFSPPGCKKKYKKKICVPEDKSLVLFVGRLEYLKGADILLKIIRSVNKQSDKYFFAVIGEGVYHDAINSVKNVRCFGDVQHDEIHNFYRAADVFILPSRNEGLPNVILEALACGTPVIATGVGEIPSVVSNICHSCDDFVKFLLNKNWKLDRLPVNFEYNTLKKKYLTVLEELTGR